ncbi:MAG: hypothetical protein JO111_13840 [Caulobacteraceae bacterium]|nr:hypothetical protein [Caulobacteraceae bacterium]
MSLSFHKATGRLALCVFLLAGAPALAQHSAPNTQTAAPAPLPRAFAGYAQPVIPSSACRAVEPAETRCEIPAMTAGRYLIEATGTATSQGAGAQQQMEIVVGDQLCGAGRDTAAWPSGARSFRFDCLTTVLTDKPLEIRAIYNPVNAAKDSKGPQLVVRPLGWNGVLSTLPFAPSR